jgi:hypothetical protein
MQCRDAQSGGLLEALLSEEHPLSEGPELRDGSATQSILRQDRRDPGGRMPLSAQASDKRHGITDLAARRKAVEQLQ